MRAFLIPGSFACAVAIAMLGCIGDASTGPQTVTVRGTVSSSLGGGVQGVRVYIDGGDLTTTSDANGGYTIDGVGRGSHLVSVADSSFPGGCLGATSSSTSRDGGATVTADFVLDCVEIAGTWAGKARATTSGAISDYLTTLGGSLVPTDSFPFTVTATTLGRNTLSATFTGSGIDETATGGSILGPYGSFPDGLLTGTIAAPLITVTCTNSGRVDWTVARSHQALQATASIPLTCSGAIPNVGDVSQAVTVGIDVTRQ